MLLHLKLTAHILSYQTSLNFKYFMSNIGLKYSHSHEDFVK